MPFVFGKQTAARKFAGLGKSQTRHWQTNDQAATDSDEAAKSKAESEESKATAEGDLKVTKADFEEDLSTLGSLHHDCMTKANEFETETKSRGEELKALATAKKIVIEPTSMAQTSRSPPGPISSASRLSDTSAT